MPGMCAGDQLEVVVCYVVSKAKQEEKGGNPRSPQPRSRKERSEGEPLPRQSSRKKNPPAKREWRKRATDTGRKRSPLKRVGCEGGGLNTKSKSRGRTPTKRMDKDPELSRGAYQGRTLHSHILETVSTRQTRVREDKYNGGGVKNYERELDAGLGMKMRLGGENTRNQKGLGKCAPQRNNTEPALHVICGVKLGKYQDGGRGVAQLSNE